MSVAFRIVLLLLVQSSFLQGMLLLPPQNVTLTSENFYTFLAWHPAPGSSSNTQYEVERYNGNRSSPGWIKETSCRGDNLKVIQSCQLHLPDLYTHYYARVRAQVGSQWSDWTNSNTLQLYKDTVIGPLNLSLVVADHYLTVSVSMPQTPLQKSESIKIMNVMDILVALLRENKTIHKVKVGYSLARMNHTFGNIEPNGNYCVKASVIYQPAKEAVQCIKTPGSQADNVRVPFGIASLILGGFILLGVVGSVVWKHHIAVQSSEVLLPQSLTFLDSNPLAFRAVLSLDEDSIASLSPVCFVSHHNMLKEQERGPCLFVPSGGNTQQLSAYCANGLHWEALGAEDAALLSGALGDTFSSRGSVAEECPTEGNSKSSPGCLELSVYLSPAAEGLHPRSTGTGSWELAGEIGEKSGEVRWSALSTRTDVLLDSLKLQNVLDRQGLKHDSCLPVEECHAYPEAQVQHITGSLAHQEQYGLCNDTEGPPGSNPERSDAIRFPGYEPHPFILL